MLITVQAGTTISGHKFSETTNFTVAGEAAMQMIAQGIASLPTFDGDRRCEINTNWDAIKNQYGAIEVYSGGDNPEFVLPAEFPLEHLPAAVSAFESGQCDGARHGRVKLQSELRALLNAEAAEAVIA